MKDIRKYLLDIILTIDDLLEFGSEYTLEDLDVKRNQWAIERGISIIGEAAYQCSKLDKGISITDLPQITGTRHIIVHDYDRVDNSKLLIIIKNHLPVLRKEVQHILDKMQ